MPCHVEDDGSYERDRLNRLTQILCAACKQLDAGHPWKRVLRDSPGLRAWWIDHQEKDRAREAREAAEARADKAKSRALSKLTDEERRALFPYGE